MIIAALSATTLGYLTGILFAVIALALVVSLTVVNAVLAKVGGGPNSHLASIGGSLGKVADNTDPVPPTLLAINDGLAALAKEMRAILAHLATGKAVFDGYADGTMG
ncbi:MAG TPA: hypothetical protein VH134_15940 [Candidatus Dormibacteraeota bacterium]|jgi:hypothetical protein|nr:hypothetical protein [Candidatus Dormibacteraeota bacterium]